MTKGISGIVKNGGKIQFIVSPYLSQEDVEAIQKGYEKKKVIEQALLREYKEPENYFQEERLNLLSHLIENGNLEIKVAFTPPNKSTGMYHEKVGIVTDAEGNKIVFTGSLNETINAFYNNYESIVVFTSWEESKQYAEEMQKDFELLWNNESKLVELKKLMQNYKDDTHILVYCGATRVQTFEYDESEHDEEGERQIVAVSKILGNELGMKVTHFTSNESAEEREVIKRRFATADPYQAIVAIKCLDEGVNIPSIKTAFILASTTNPKEYIQRRGRVLRLANNKPYAVIYDFVTLVKPLDEVNPYSTDYNCERALAKRELARIKEFGEISLNSRDSDELINDLECAYELSDEELEDIDDGAEFR